MIITGKKYSQRELSRVINGDRELPTAPERPETLRLDHALVSKYGADLTRAALQKLIKQGRAKVNGTVIKKPSYPVLKTDTVEFDAPEVKKHPAAPRPEVIYEDEQVLVLNKPIGLLSMSKGAYNPEATLEDYGLLVHRLDRDTSGVVILAKNKDTRKMLQKQFQDRKTHKTYRAVVLGHPKEDAARLDLPIARSVKHPTTFLVRPGGKPSETYYQVLEKSAHYALLELKPTTGRTHQLRVHLKYIGTPILGDRLYGDPAANAKLPIKSEKDPEPRLYLHAKELEITIPGETGGQRRVFSAPVPQEFEDVLRGDL